MHSDPDRRIYVVEAKSNPKIGPLEKCTLAMIGERYKLISYLGYGSYRDVFELYDLVNDPDEMHDLSQTEPRIAEDMLDELAVVLSEKKN